jgi:hypothetical protein
MMAKTIVERTFLVIVSTPDLASAYRAASSPWWTPAVSSCHRPTFSSPSTAAAVWDV